MKVIKLGITVMDYKSERSTDVDKIKDSAHPRKVVVAGPGTGKSFLFSELIRKKQSEGKANFLAITFIGKLGDALADDLCGLAETMTMHGFARDFVLHHYNNCQYYPRMYELIAEDLQLEGITNFEISDEKYKEKTTYYQAVGDADVVYYAVQICKKDPSKIPVYDLVLIDEYQDFNEIESEFVDLLAQRNEVVIVGDDDQALYEFKGSSPSFIREKHDSGNADFESHTLRFCSRCTEVIIKYFHSLVTKFGLHNPSETDPKKRRISKDYLCYIPDKSEDSTSNPKIHALTSCPPGMIAYKIQTELENIVSQQKIKEVLIIGEGQSCGAVLKSIFTQLRGYGFKNVSYKQDGSILGVQRDITDAYKFIAKNETSLLGWRILGNPTDEPTRSKHIANSKTLKRIIQGTPSELRAISQRAIDKLELDIEPNSVPDKDIRKQLLFKELKENNIHLPRPLGNLNITICNILNSKGLGADIVFLVGFDQGRFPSKKIATDSEVYQMLVAITRAKKRVYLINTVGKNISSFIECLDPADLDIRQI